MNSSKREILFCSNCSKYLLDSICSCGNKAVSNKPAKWSPTDKYSKYRVRYKSGKVSE